MFHEVASIGTLSMQLVYFRGSPGLGGECKASRWVDDPLVLAKVMTKITCDAGETQIARVLNHVAGEGSQRKINALVFVGDACEEGRDQLAEGAARPFCSKFAHVIRLIQARRDVLLPTIRGFGKLALFERRKLP
jgi:hypothetical protein